jgi:DNA-binding protein H-NS
LPKELFARFLSKVIKRMKSVRRPKAAKRSRQAGPGNGKLGAVADPLLDELSVLELKELGGRVVSAIAARQADARAALREEFRELAQAAGYTLAEVLDGRRGGKGKAGEAKFANPDDSGETWSGRGRMPNWLSSRLKAGASLEAFRL